MKNINFTKGNLESLKLYEFKNLDKIALFFIIDSLNRINFLNIDSARSIIEIRNENNIESICFTMHSKRCLPIEIVLHLDYIDMSVSNFQPIREMYKINIKKINEELSFLNKWLSCDIINEFKKSNNFIIKNIFYCNSAPNEIIFKSITFFGFLSIGKNDRKDFKSWAK